jgi:hypothetical protein
MSRMKVEGDEVGEERRLHFVPRVLGSLGSGQ